MSKVSLTLGAKKKSVKEKRKEKEEVKREALEVMGRNEESD